MYIRKEIANFLQQMPKEMKLPKHWRAFVNEKTVKYNLIIKHGKEYECTNCHKFFPSNVDIGEFEICPFCKNKYMVRNHNLKKYTKLFDLAIVDNVNNKIVIRYFEVMSAYNYQKRIFENSVVEYARIVPELEIELVNDRFTKYLSSEWVRHTKRIKRWRVFTGMYGLQQYYKALYLENIEEKLKGTIYQYVPFKKIIEYLGNDKIDLLDLLKKAKYPSFELLIKADLYNLALEYPEKFNEKGSFEKRFGVGKEYYNFMKKHNITYLQLQVLKLIKRKNMKKINRILKIGFEDIKKIEKASNYVNLIKLEEYAKRYKNFSISSYLDYLRNLEKLEVPLNNKKVLFPDDFWQAHNDSVQKVKIVGNSWLDKKINKRYQELSKNIHSNNIFLIRPAKNLKDMKNEAKQQNNCVYKNYSEKYAFGDTDIYFLREVKTPEKALVTIEVNENKVVQSRIKNDYAPTRNQNEFIKKWEKEILSAA